MDVEPETQQEAEVADMTFKDWRKGWKDRLNDVTGRDGFLTVALIYYLTVSWGVEGSAILIGHATGHSPYIIFAGVTADRRDRP